MMNMPFNPMQLMQMIMGGGNPQQIMNMLGNKQNVIAKLKEIGGNNPSIPTLIKAIEEEDLGLFQNTVRNLYKSQGKDINQIMNILKRR